MSRDQIAKNMMFATANLINNEDPERLPELTTEYWKAAVAFDAEFCDDATAMAMAKTTIETFVNTLQTA